MSNGTLKMISRRLFIKALGFLGISGGFVVEANVSKPKLKVVKFNEDGRACNYEELMEGVPFQKGTHDQFGRSCKVWGCDCWTREVRVWVNESDVIRRLDIDRKAEEFYWGEVVLKEQLSDHNNNTYDRHDSYLFFQLDQCPESKIGRKTLHWSDARCELAKTMVEQARKHDMMKASEG
jgi:hypothetical protein